MFGFLGSDVKTKMVSIFIIVLILVLLYFFGYKKIREAIINLKIKNAATKKAQSQASLGIFATYKDAEYKTFANRLYVAMKGAGTNTSAVETVLKSMKNEVDGAKLVAAFGVRDGETLQEWLAGEMLLKTAYYRNLASNIGIYY